MSVRTASTTYDYTEGFMSRVHDVDFDLADKTTYALVGIAYEPKFANWGGDLAATVFDALQNLHPETMFDVSDFHGGPQGHAVAVGTEPDKVSTVLRSLGHLFDIVKDSNRKVVTDGLCGECGHSSHYTRDCADFTAYETENNH
jgi:hypothetical protein